jgi:hypothetical protein
MPKIEVKVVVPLLLFDGKYYQRDEVLKVEEDSLRLCLTPFVEVLDDPTIKTATELAAQKVNPVLAEPEANPTEPKAETKTKRSKNTRAD